MADASFLRNGALAWLFSTGERLIQTWRSSSIQTATSILGTGLLAVTIIRSTRSIWKNFLRPGRLQTFKHAPTGSWALVTGASDGIGFAFAEELLDRGFHVLIHGRNESKLSKARDKLAAEYPNQSVRFVVADASSLDRPEQIVADAVNTIPGKLTVLVNNIGGQNPNTPFATLSQLPHETIDELLNLNIRFGIQLTRLLLPKLQANSPSLVLNSGGLAGVLGMGYISTYSAAKGFLHTLTTALRQEAYGEKSGVEITTLIIGNTKSNSNAKNVPFATITSRECARGCLDRVGHGDAFVYASWKHLVPSMVLSSMSERTLADITVKEMKGRDEGERKVREKAFLEKRGPDGG